MQKCIKCGYQRTESDQFLSDQECPACGVIYSKIQNKPCQQGGGHDVYNPDASVDMPLDEKRRLYEEEVLRRSNEAKVMLGLGLTAFGMVLVCVSATSFQSVIEWVLILAVIGFVLFCIITASIEEEKRKSVIRVAVTDSVSKELQEMPDFNVTKKYLVQDSSAFIAIDEGALKLALGGVMPGGQIGHYRVVHAREIRDVEITENGRGVLSTSPTKNTLGMAAVGGLLFGGTGAVVGAIAGSNTKTKVSDITLKIAIDDIESPYIGIQFLSETVPANSPQHQRSLNIAEKWFGIVNILKGRVETGLHQA